jgi:(p)ppGpp synthase/HD superfamily hydrolase
MLTEAIIIATKAHKNQVDKAGEPYILHPLRVMIKMNSIDLKIVAILHDVIEDSDYDDVDLINAGFTNEIVDAVVCLTKRKNENYMDYIKRCKTNYLAKIVKLADLEDNSDLSRIKNPTEKDYERTKKYRAAVNELLYN